jgi:hypothetical protein
MLWVPQQSLCEGQTTKITWMKDDVMNDPVYFAIFEASTHTHNGIARVAAVVDIFARPGFTKSGLTRFEYQYTCVTIFL